MEKIPSHLIFDVIQYMDIKTYITYSCVSKETQKKCKEYLKIKKLEFERNNIKKTIKNSLYKLNSVCSSPHYKNPQPRGQEQYSKNQIIKIKKVVICPREPENTKIYYWVISDMGIIYDKKRQKNMLCIYPDWCSIKNLEDDNFIPFY